MSNKQNVTQNNAVFRLNPLSACVRLAIAGGVLLGSVSPVHAELPVPRDVWVSNGGATKEIAGDTLKITQETDRAILNWQSFNVGAKNQVIFDQKLGSSSIALNRIFQGDPSQILGKVTANGQVYLYNQNGFVFGKDSVVDVNSLVASTLNITDEVFENGIVTEFDENDGNAALDGTGSTPSTAAIKVNAGAKIHIGKNGRLIMAAPEVSNAGSIDTQENGQIILVASKDKVFLQPVDSNSPFAGLLVEVGSGGKVSNVGDILARQGNVTLAGFAVNQGGRVTATTSVNVNGSIRLLARESAGIEADALVATRTDRDVDLKDGLGKESKVTFTDGSITEVVADQSGGKAIDEQIQPDSYLEVSANTVHMQSGSSIVSPSGNVNITATDNLSTPLAGDKGRIILEEGSVIDVSGTKHIAASVERNVAEVSVQTFELRDSPLQKGGVLQGKTIRVDIREDNPIVDISGAKARFERTIDERLGTGGEINMTSSGDIIANNNAAVDISGGSIDFQEGNIKTTKLLTDYGKIVGISDADPNEHYDSIYGVITEVNEKWGVKKVWDIQDQFSRGRFEQGYTQGLDAGALNIVAPKLLWNADLTAGSVNNTFQRAPDKTPFGGAFTFNQQDNAGDRAGIFLTTQNISFQTENHTPDLDLADKFPKDAKNQPLDLVLTTALMSQSGIQTLNIKTAGSVTVTADADVEMNPGGELKVDAGEITVKGSIYSAGGTINLTSLNTGITENSGKINVASEAVLDASGRWINDFELSLDAEPVDPLVIDGGTVKLTATGDLDMHKGSVIRADGGAWLGFDSRLAAGKGGAISLGTQVRNDSGSSLLNPEGELSASGIYENGSLSLATGKIIVGTSVSAEATDALVLKVNDGKLDIAKTLGFSEINLISNGKASEGITVIKDTRLDLIAQNRVLNADFRSESSGKGIASISRMETLPEHLRNTVDLNLSAAKDIKLEEGSAVLGDKEASIGLATTEGGIFVDGTIDAPAGSINLEINADPAVEYDASQAIWLGEHAKLSAVGTTRMNATDTLGRRNGDVLDGGEVTLAAQRGYVILQQGSEIDVSGTKTVLDLPSSDSSTSIIKFAAAEVASNAGKITLAAAEGAILDGSLKGLAGSGTNLGGRIDLSLDRSDRNPPDPAQIPFPKGALVLNVIQDDLTELVTDTQFGDVIPDRYNGQMTVSANNIETGGFSDVRLAVHDTDENFFKRDEVRFLGDVNLTANQRIDIDSAKVTWGGLNDSLSGAVNLNTAYLRIGSSLIRENDVLPATGEGLFTANAQSIELGGSSLWDGFKQIDLNSEHDLRTVGINPGTSFRDYIGSMVTAANLNLKAGQIYPSTLSKFTFAVKNNPTGQINISGNQSTDASPLSAGGVLNIEAPEIHQNGVVKAPFGTINLAASSSLTLGEKSLTSVSGDGQLIPLGVIQGGLDWLYPLDSNQNLVFDAPPEKKLLLSAPDVKLLEGSVIDLSGGGDLLAYEFLPGSGGSFDYLDPNSSSYQGGFAVVPSLGSALAPFDHLQSAAFDVPAGGQIYLSGTAGLPAGTYTLLPARYALLPGAYLVTPQANTRDQTTTTFTKAGLPVVAGYQTVAGTGTRDSRWRGFLIESGADIRKRSEYDERKADAFYAADALKNETSTPILPMDSGQISIAAQNQLELESDFNVKSSSGRGARMDITANRLKIVKSLSNAPEAGVLEVLAGDLSDLGVDSLFLGGSRSTNITTGATDLSVTADEVVFENDAKVKVADLIAAAGDKVEVKSGAVIRADGTVNTGDSLFNIVGDGAFLRVSADDQAILQRTSAAGDNGVLSIQKGAVLASSKSMLLDASQSTVLAGDIQMDGGSLNLSANTINIGEVDGLSGTALNLSNEKLINLAVDELVLSSRDTINFYGDVGQVDSTGNLNALKFNNLVMNAAGFSGYGDKSQSAKLQAENLQLKNTLAAVATQEGQGQGELDIMATHYTQGDGNFEIQGFNNIKLTASEKFNASGKGELVIGGNLNLTAGYITAAGGSNLKINVAGHNALLQGNGSSVTAADISLGGAINVVANAINFNAGVLMPSGSLGLSAIKGDVSIAEQAAIDLAGTAVNFADTVKYTQGGSINVSADHGKITFAEGSVTDLSGGGTAKAGTLSLKAPQQTVDLSGQITAAGGSAEVDVSGFSSGQNFDGLMNAFKTAGISDTLYFRSRDADIVQGAGSVISADSITLVADKGAMNLSGKLNADNTTEGGAISLYAGDKIILENSAALTAMGNKGGKVLLSSVDNDEDKVSGIDIRSGSLIDVSGGADKTMGGEVTLRALRLDTDKDGKDDSINIASLAGTVRGYAQKAAVIAENGDVLSQGYSKFYAEGVKKYTNSDFSVAGEINSADINRFKQDTDAYMTSENMQKVTNDLGGDIRLKAGIEIAYDGDLTIKDKWDLVDWRYSESSHLVNLPGALTINATGNLNVANSISDGFKDAVLLGFVNVKDMLQTGDSWSYRLTAGADINSADTVATAFNKDLVIGSGATVRTGAGDMTLGAGGNFVLTDQTSTVYNAGRPDDTARFGTLDENFVAFLLYSEYPVDGGDLTIKAGKDIIGAVSNQFIDSWLLRVGNWSHNSTHELELPTAWGVALGYTTDGFGNAADASTPLFQENIGSFGGGKVDISAAGNIKDLSVMVPTTGKQLGQPDNDPNTLSDFVENLEPQINGGGEMSVSAGGDIAGGAYFLGKGNGEISAGGAITGSNNQFIDGPQLAMGDTHLSLSANNGINISAVSDAMILHSGNNWSPDGTNFFSYTDSSGIALSALSGDVHLGADTSVIGATDILSLTGSQQNLSKIYPASLQAVAFGGSVLLDDQVTLFPSPTGTLNIFAAKNIASNVDSLRLNMSDADKTRLPTAIFPLERALLNSSGADAILNPFGIKDLVHAAIPLHVADQEPVRLVTKEGDIKSIQVNVPKKAIVQSGNDITNALIDIQHVNVGDVSIISAGRDIRYTSDRDTEGILKANFAGMQIAGPGSVFVKAGRNIDFGASNGLTTIGDIGNSNLSTSVSSDITILAGLNSGSPDYSAFFDIVRYAENYSDYKTLVTQFMRERSGNLALAEADALQAFRQLDSTDYAAILPQLTALSSNVYSAQYTQIEALITPFMQHFLGDPTLSAAAALKAFSTLTANQYLSIQPQLTALVDKVFFNELKVSGSASAASASAGNERGFGAIDTLFPGAEWKGNLSLFFSTIQTFQGGDINLLVPGGEVNAGLAVSFAGAKDATDLGIVAQGEGNVNAFVNNDFIVNQSRVFALIGGDILIWSSKGDIDAGRGAKSAIAAPPPVHDFDKNGNATTTFRAIVSGSGIRTSAPVGSVAGDVFLFAPKGVVNAGEAGIGGTNVTISATAVLGANNIQVGGISTGVPTASTGSLAAGLTGVSNLTASVSQVAQASADMSKDSEESNKKGLKLGVLSVDLLGYGEGDANENKKKAKGKPVS